jgi:hypothetical protein
MSNRFDGQFEYRRRDDGLSWEIFVTWSHSLRERVQGTIFVSEGEAARWIERESSGWLVRENVVTSRNSAVRPKPRPELNPLTQLPSGRNRRVATLV